MSKKEKVYFCDSCGGDFYPSHNYCGRCGSYLYRRTILQSKELRWTYILMILMPPAYIFVFPEFMGITIRTAQINSALLIISLIVFVVNVVVAAIGLSICYLLRYKRWLFLYMLMITPIVFVAFSVVSIWLMDLLPLWWGVLWIIIFFLIRRDYVVLKKVVHRKPVYKAPSEDNDPKDNNG